MLTDEVTIKVTAGKGGSGIVSFRRERFVPKGGPDGGDGGKGGDVILKVNPSTHGLSEFATKKTFKAEDGQSGQGSKKTGRSAKDLILSVPLGTLVYEKLNGKEQLIADLTTNRQEVAVAHGGAGGLGNVHFVSATHQVPREATPGESGKKKTLRLELRLIADVGIVGLPNAGKSTFLARVSAAKPKIADYPFTTLEPNLGVVDIDKFKFVLADIPGLVEGAAEGKGLGIAFLRHVLRNRLIVHLIAADTEDPHEAYKTVRKELNQYAQGLEKMPEIVVVSKVELLTDKQQRRLWQELKKHDPIFLSAVTGRGVKDLLYRIKKELSKSAVLIEKQ